MNPEELVNWINDMYKFFEYEDMEDETKLVLKAEEKLARKLSGRGKISARGRSTEQRDGASSLNQQESSGSDSRGRRGSSRGRSRGRGREYRCYICGKIEHRSFECPENARTDQRNVIVTQAEEREEVQEAEKVLETGESLLLKKNLLRPKKEVVEPAQRKPWFKTVCKFTGKCCKVVIDNGSTDNLVSTKVVEKLNLKKTKHPTPYKVYWFQKGHQLLVNEQSEVEMQIGSHKDKILCDKMPMDDCHILLADLGSLTEVLHIMGRKILTSFRRMA
eukprot:PITA_11700